MPYQATRFRLISARHAKTGFVGGGSMSAYARRITASRRLRIFLIYGLFMSQRRNIYLALAAIFAASWPRQRTISPRIHAAMDY